MPQSFAMARAISYSTPPVRCSGSTPLTHPGLPTSVAMLSTPGVPVVKVVAAALVAGLLAAALDDGGATAEALAVVDAEIVVVAVFDELEQAARRIADDMTKDKRRRTGGRACALLFKKSDCQNETRKRGVSELRRRRTVWATGLDGRSVRARSRVRVCLFDGGRVRRRELPRA